MAPFSRVGASAPGAVPCAASARLPSGSSSRDAAANTASVSERYRLGGHGQYASIFIWNGGRFAKSGSRWRASCESA